MIKNPLLIVGVLLGFEILILFLSNHKKFERYFSFLPAVFWIYFLPMVISTLGIITAESPVYKMASTWILPASLFILLVTVDLKSIFKLGSKALIMFFAGSAGIVLGAPIVFSVFRRWIGDDFWSGFGAISASWTGGSANMIAVKEAIGTPDQVFLPMVIVDTIVPYVWMGILVAMVGFQIVFDRWNKSDRNVLAQFEENRENAVRMKHQWDFKYTVLIIVLGIAASYLTQTIGAHLPEIKDVIKPYAWTIILVTTLALILSFSPLKNLEKYHSSKIGYFLLYFVLTTIGAKASLQNLGSAATLIAAGFCIVGIHIVFLLIAARLTHSPMFLVAAASQANIGGVASAPVVAEIYQPGLASVGLLLAILGNIVGTYLGILAAHLCRLTINF